MDAEHPDGVWAARCGQRLFMGTSLYGEPPPGLRCERCHLIFLADTDIRP